MSPFFAIVLSIWAVLHAYVAARLVVPIRRRWLKVVSVVAWLGFSALSPFAFVSDELLAYPYDLVYRWIAYIYMGAFTTLFALLACRDLIWTLGRFAYARLASSSSVPPSPERRRFLLNATNGGAVGIAGLLTWIGVREARRVPEVVAVDVPVEGLPEELEGYHIVQLSDVHVGLTIDKDFILPIIEVVTSLNPDLIALTGDLVDGSVDKLHEDFSPFGYLRAKDALLCVTGNHEYYAGVEEWCMHFRELGFSVLNNAHVLIERGKARLLVAGVTDYREGQHHPGHASDPALALRDAPAHDVRILLAHQPKSARAAQGHGFALQLSGHTHGGQYFPWNLFVGLVEPFPTGLTRVRDMWLYVSRGTCYWGPPVRTGVPPEITSIRLRRA